MRESHLRYLVRGAVMVLFVMSFVAFNGKFWESNPTLYPQRHKAYSTNRVVLADDIGTDNTTEEAVQCSFTFLDLAEDKCKFVMETEDCAPAGFVNYLALRYCSLDNAAWFSYVVLVVVMVFLFYLLGGTAERFFCPALQRVSEGLKMSPNVAGVTLLALGNGSPDIFANIAAIQQNEFSQALGALLGAGMFVVTVVVGAVSIAAKGVPATVTRRPFLRDIIFYQLVVLFVFFLCWDHKIRVWQAALFIVFYFSYVGAVLFGRLVYQRRKKKKIDRMRHLTAINTADVVDLSDEVDEDGNPLPKPTAGSSEAEMQSYSSSIIGDDEEDEEDEEDDDDGDSVLEPGVELDVDAELDPVLQSVVGVDARVQVSPSKPSLRNRIARRLKKFVYLAKFGLVGKKKPHARRTVSRIDDDDDDMPKSLRAPLLSAEDGADLEYEDYEPSKRQQPNCCSRFWRGFKFHVKGLAEYFDWPEMTARGKVFFLLQAPRFLIQHLTIPWAEENKYWRFFYVLNPIAIVIFCFSAFQAWGFLSGAGPLWPWMLGVAVLLSLFVYFTTNNYEPPRYEPVFIGIGMVMSVLWIYFIANELVSLLNAAGVMLRISSTIMGLTILAWGNSVGDTISNIVVSRHGQPQMAIGACFAAPLTNILLGLGISIVAVAARSGGADFVLGPTLLKNNMFFGFVFLLATNLLTAIVVPLSGFTFTKKYGIVLLIIYALFTTVSFLTEFRIIFPTTEVWELWYLSGRPEL